MDSVQTMKRGPQGDRRDICFKTSAWQRLLYDKALDESPDLAGIEDQGAGRFGAWGGMQREVFSRLYAADTPRLEPQGEGAPWTAKAWEQAEALPEWRRLTEHTRGDSFATSIATTSIADALLEVLPGEQKEDPAAVQQEIDAALDLLNETTNPELRKQSEKDIAAMKRRLARAQGQGAEAAGATDESMVRNALRAAAQGAQEAVNDANEAVAALGPGSQPGGPGRGISAATKAALARRVRKDPHLAEIARLAGRFRRIAAAKQREKVRHVPDEIADVETGADLGRLLPAELARLGHPALRLGFARDYLERKLLCYRLDGREAEAAGPIVFCLDESGSMSGGRDAWAKAIFLALLDIAARQRRPAALVHFDVRVPRVDLFEPGRYGQAEVLDALTFFCGGGTSFGPPLDRARKLIEAAGAFKKADVILISDGEAGEAPAEWDAWRRSKGVSCYGIAIGYDPGPAMLGACDEVRILHDLRQGTGEEKEVADLLFGI